MPRATTAFHNRIALVFDFDLTLAPGSLDALLRRLGVDPQAFREERVYPLDDAGWDHSLARCHALIQLSEEQDGSVTEEVLHQVGAELDLFRGLPGAFDRLRAVAQHVAEGVGVEFYVLTAGYAEIVNGTALRDECEAVWGSTFHFGEDGRVVFPKRVVTYAEKVRYLMALAKGLAVEGHDSPSDIWRPRDDDDYHVPFDQMIYVGDGSSDMPAFDLMEDRGGIAVGVTKDGRPERWADRHEVHAERRVQNLAEAGYTESDELYRTLELSVESIAKLVAVRRLGRGE